MTYEQASALGLRFRRDDDSILTYRDGVLQHFTAAMTTAETAARNREKLLRDFLEFRRSAIQEGERGPVREYLLPPGADRSRSERLARLLVAQGFDVHRADEPIKLASRQLPPGTWIIPTAQPGSRLLRNLLEPHVAQPEGFLKEQERRRKKRLGEQIYDVTAWSLPLAFDVEILTAERPAGVRSSPVAGGDLSWTLVAGTTASAPPATPLPASKIGYLLPWGSATAAVVVEGLRRGIRMRTADLPFTLGGRTFPGGTVVVRHSENANLAATLGAVASPHGAEIVPFDSTFVEGGISLGSGFVQPLKAPAVLMAWDTPVSSLSAGWTRYVLERRYGQPVTIVRTASLARVDLTRYEVLVLPSGTYSAISGDLLRRLKDWISAGGTLITLAEASRWASRESVGLLSTTTELKGGRPEVEQTDPKAAEAKKDAPPQPIDLEKTVQPEWERPGALPGALLRATLDTEHWLSAGTDGEVQVMVEGSRVFTPIKLDKGRNVATYATVDRLVASGLVWDELKPQVASKAFLIAPAARPGPCDRLRGRSQLPRLHGRDVAAVHQRGAAGAGALSRRSAASMASGTREISADRSTSVRKFVAWSSTPESSPAAAPAPQTQVSPSPCSRGRASGDALAVRSALPAMNDRFHPNPSSPSDANMRNEPPCVDSAPSRQAQTSTAVPIAITRGAPTRSVRRPVSGARANMPSVCADSTSPMRVKPTPPCCMCSGVIVIGSTIAICAAVIAESARRTAEFAALAAAALALDAAGSVTRPESAGRPGMANITSAAASIAAAAATYGPTSDANPAWRESAAAGSASDGPVTAPIVAAQTIQPITVARRSAGKRSAAV